MTDKNANTHPGIKSHFTKAVTPANIPVLTPDQEAFIQKIMADLDDAGIKQPRMNGFPDGQDKEGYQNSKNVVGIGSDGPVLRSIRNLPDTGLFSEAGPCENNTFSHPQSIENVRAFVLAHEVAHYIDRTTGMSADIQDHVAQQVRGKYKDMDGKEMIRINILERTADMAAALYIRANYPEKSGAINAFQDFRVMNIDDVRHNTGSSVELAQKSFAQNPRRNISIVEATEWATQILDGQKDNIAHEQVTMNATNNIIKTSPMRALGITDSITALDVFMTRGMGGVPDSVSGDHMKEVESAARQARDNFCATPPAQPPKLNL